MLTSLFVDSEPIYSSLDDTLGEDFSAFQRQTLRKVMTNIDDVIPDDHGDDVILDDDVILNGDDLDFEENGPVRLVGMVCVM